jgi:hypothetical protein
MLYYKMVRKTPVESAVWIPNSYIKAVAPIGTLDLIEALESIMPGWVCVGYNLRPVEAGGDGYGG